MEAMTSRMESVVTKLNAAAGTHLIVRLGAASDAAVAHADGIVTVDSTVLWRLSEDALAASIAREFGRESLCYRSRVDSSNPDWLQRAADVSSKERELELAADEYAGRLVAKAGYGGEGYAEVLDLVECADAHSQPVAQYYLRHQREAVFRRAYEQVRTEATAATASRPGTALNDH